MENKKSVSQRIQEARERLSILRETSKKTDARLDQLKKEGDREWEAFQRDEDLPPKSPTSIPARIPNLHERLDSVRASRERFQQLTVAGDKLMKEMQAIPLEKGCDEVYEDVGEKLEMLYQEDLDNADQLSRELDAGERDELEEERLEKEGSPPPIIRK